MVAEWRSALTGVGPSWHPVTMYVKILCRFSTAARIKIKLKIYAIKEKENNLPYLVVILNK